jgi:hypothetical protein
MLHTLVQVLSKREIVVAEIGIGDWCNNGFDEFRLNVTLYSTKGDETAGYRYLHENTLYYFVEGGYECEELVKQYFPKLMPIYLVKGCDIFGFNDYPILNGYYHLTHGNPEYTKESLRITEEQLNTLKQNKSLFYTNFCLELERGQYRAEVAKAIKLIEQYSGKKYVKTNFVSGRLYNDIHYQFITESKGWNVYKGNKSTIKEYPI